MESGTTRSEPAKVKIGVYDSSNGPFQAQKVGSKMIVPHPDPAIEGLPRCYDLMPKKKSKDPKAKEQKKKFKLPKRMILTAYDDGGACPGGCKIPHVVFHKEVNGTSRAHDPSSKGKKYEKCVRGQDCKVCVYDAEDCLVTKYKGAGPPFGVFDFAVGFYQQNCGKDKLPKSFQKKCDYYAKKTKKYQGKINCIKNQTNASCAPLIQSALAAKKQDLIDYNDCKKQGQKKFNLSVTPERRRKYNCTYSDWKYTFQSSYKAADKDRVKCKKAWHMLKPGACGANTFVGPYGLDCCPGNAYMAVALGSECNIYFQDQQIEETQDAVKVSK